MIYRTMIQSVMFGLCAVQRQPVVLESASPFQHLPFFSIQLYIKHCIPHLVQVTTSWNNDKACYTMCAENSESKHII